MFCPDCGQQTIEGKRFCSRCGGELRLTAPPQSEGSKAERTVGDLETQLPGSRGPRLEAGALVARRYEVEDLLGEGGMGVVYRVRDRKLDERFALKAMHAHLLEREQAMKRFLEEARISLRLTHRGIVRVHHLGEHEGLSYLTMELLEGRSLRELLKGHASRGEQLAIGTVRTIALQILEALEFAHRSTVHRDIKPENIFLEGEPPDYRVKLLDFGIAKALDRETHTTTSASLGTAWYMAPEQRDGAGDVDARSDLYSVGVVLYEMLIGELPTGVFEPPSERRPDLGTAWDDVVLSALTRAPDKRPATASEMAKRIVGQGATATKANRRAVTEQLAPERPASAVPERPSSSNVAAAVAPVTKRPSVRTPNATAVCPSPRAEPPSPALRPPSSPQQRGVSKRRSQSLWLLAISIVAVVLLWIVSQPADGIDPGPNLDSSEPGRPGSLETADLRVTGEAWPAGKRAGETRELTVNGALFRFAWIPPGSDRIGSPGDEPGRHANETQWTARFSTGFWMQTTEVTQTQWQALMRENPSRYKDCGADCPVESVSWNRVQEFLQALNREAPGGGFRLPKEAEWEYAARAGTDGPFGRDCPDYNDSNVTSRVPCLDRIAWYRDNPTTGQTTHPVGQLPANAWGLLDMHGNVWEWCEDGYDYYPSGTQTDWRGRSGSTRVLRGGSWFSDAGITRSAYRYEYEPDYDSFYVGFRLAREVR